MVYTENDIERIVSFKTWSNKKKIDELCRIDCDMYCNLGIDSTKTEKLKVKSISRKIYRAIKTIDVAKGNLFLTAMDDIANA